MALDKPLGQPGPLQPGEFTPSQPANVISFRTSQVDLPSALYLQRDDQLTLLAVSNLANEQVIFNWRLLLPTGYIQTGQLTMALTLSSVVITKTIPLAEGFLLSVSATPSSAAQSRGQTFATAKITRGTGGTTTVQSLFADYITTNVQTGWPGGRQINSLEGPGALTSVVPTGLPANSWTIANLTNQAAYLRAFELVLTTSATVATRVPKIGLQNAAATLVAVYEPNGTVTAGTTVVITGGTPPITQPASVTDIIIGLPANILMAGGWSIFSTGTNIQAGDSYTTVQVVFEYLCQI